MFVYPYFEWIPRGRVRNVSCPICELEHVDQIDKGQTAIKKDITSIPPVSGLGL